MKKILVLLAALFVCAAAYVPCRAQYISGYADLSDSDVTALSGAVESSLASLLGGTQSVGEMTLKRDARVRGYESDCFHD